MIPAFERVKTFHALERPATVILYFQRTARRYSIRDNSVGIATGWTTGVRCLAGVRDFSLLHSVQTGSGDPASYRMGTGGSFTGGKANGA
jgi:hypothetical protein